MAEAANVLEGVKAKRHERSTSEILARIDELSKGYEDFFGFIAGDLIEYLPFAEAKPFLKETVTADDWSPKARSREAVVSQIVDYMPFAWNKANGCRGLSAGRSLSHMQAWLWMLGYDRAAEDLADYSLYGKPQLRAICEEFSIDWSSLDDGRWKTSEEDEGVPPPSSVAALAPAQS